MTERTVTELKQFRSIKKNTSKFSERIVADRCPLLTLRSSYDQSMNNNDKRIFQIFTIVGVGAAAVVVAIMVMVIILLSFCCATLRRSFVSIIHWLLPLSSVVLQQTEYAVV